LASSSKSVDDARIDKVLDELRDQQATLVPAEDRPARKGDWAVDRLHRAGAMARSSRAPRPNGCRWSLAKRAWSPALKTSWQGMSEGETKTFTVTFPEDYPQAELAGQPADFETRLIELREKRLPELDDDFIKSLAISPIWPRCAAKSVSASNATSAIARVIASPTESSTLPSPTRPSNCPTC
jgi:FKBP-type peptidyl-prolyl cis-trans isomerase (trigger factor)